MKQLVIYYNKEKTWFRIVKPQQGFDGDFYGLVMGITNGNYYTYEIQ
jgi:hypothetical protein